MEENSCKMKKKTTKKACQELASLGTALKWSLVLCLI